MEFSRREYWSRMRFPSQGDLPGPGIEPGSPVLQADSLPSEPPVKPGLTGCTRITVQSRSQKALSHWRPHPCAMTNLHARNHNAKCLHRIKQYTLGKGQVSRPQDPRSMEVQTAAQVFWRRIHLSLSRVEVHTSSHDPCIPFLDIRPHDSSTGLRGHNEGVPYRPAHGAGGRDKTGAMSR